ncbi:MAG: DUF1800 domain-containing protein [Luteibaculum sp.]
MKLKAPFTESEVHQEQSRQHIAFAPPTTSNRPVKGISKFKAKWNEQHAKRLLRACLFGARKAEIDLVTRLGLDAAVEKLLSPLPKIDPPICIRASGGDTLNLPWHFSDANTNQFNRKQSLQAWTVKNILHQGVNLEEKLLLFWQNHLVTGVDGVGDARYSYYYIELLRKHAFGNFKTLVKEISTNAAMLVYLSGNKNKKGSPNENYARELLELFTLGATDINGNPNYTESDVEEAARVLTGWETIKNGNGTLLAPHVRFNANQHDNGAKKFSAHFNNRTIHRPLALDYQKELDDLIDMIFSRSEVALFIVRQLYTWFVYYDIDANTETKVIAPLAKILRDNNYEVKPVLRALFASEHFYEHYAQGIVVKNPAEYVLGSIRQFETLEPLNIPIESMFMYIRIHDWMIDMQMELLNPPNVAGWSAYYQSPGYYQKWVNTATYNARSEFADFFLRKGIQSANGRFKPNLTLFAQSVSSAQAQDINALIEGAVALFFPLNITSKQKQYLKDILLGGLPDFEWTVEWTSYLVTAIQENNPNSVAMRKKLESFFHEIMVMAEYHLI